MGQFFAPHYLPGLHHQKSQSEYYSQGGSGNALKFFTLLEDVDGAGLVEVWAVASSATGVKTGDPVQVVSWEGIINGAQADYTALFSKVDGQWVFVQGPCITACFTDGEVSLGEVPDATEGSAWSHTITVSGLSVGTVLSYEDLPAWVTASGSSNNTLSGTPGDGTAGTYYVTVQGEAPGVGESEEDTCIITKVLVIVVVEPE